MEDINENTKKNENKKNEVESKDEAVKETSSSDLSSSSYEVTISSYSYSDSTESSTESTEEEEEDEEKDIEENTSEPVPTIQAQIKPHKNIFKFKRNNNGNIMTIHHTTTVDNKLIRVRIGVCCFSDRGVATQFVAVDKRGNIFVFDLTSKRYWKLGILVLKACIIVPSKYRENEYLIGTKAGQLLLVDVERSVVLRAAQVSQCAITEISFPEQQLHPKRLVLVHAGTEAIIVNLNSFSATHRLDFDECRMSLKFVCYIPCSDRIFTCFTNDSIHLWSGVTLKILQKTYPIKTRDLKLRSVGGHCIPPEFKLRDSDDSCYELDTCELEHFSDGLISAYNFTSQEGGMLCLATIDKYLIILNYNTFDVQRLFRLKDFVIKKCAFLPQTQTSQPFILALTASKIAVVLDCECPDFKLILHNCAVDINVSSDGKLLSVLALTGEAEIWTVSCLYDQLMSQRQCMRMLKDAFKQSKPLAIAPSNECFSEDIKKLLKRDRLISILKEFGYYPAKYRGLIWCSLLKLPCNRQEFQKLLKLGTPAPVAKRAAKLTFKNDTMKRALIKIWSCLANWCKVFAYSEFFPHFIFPFVKVFPRNSLITFEICVTLLLNHFQHWFEYHPITPADYLGMCENVLQHFDGKLCAFFAKHGITAKEYAWPMLSNSFSEVLNEEQWLILWDSIISSPIYYPIFCVVAYVLTHREVILLLPDKMNIERYFHEENPIDAIKLVAKALKLMKTCPEARHPTRYFKEFKPIPKRVYPKFLRYPHEWVVKHEDDLLILQREQEAIDARIRQLEFNEAQMMDNLEKTLKAEEHAKRLKEMENLYHDTIKREEERVSFQRQLLLLYQKEIRGYKGEVIKTLRESDRRKEALEMEKQIDMLSHNIEREQLRTNSAVALADDELRNQNLELMFQQQILQQQKKPVDLASKFSDDVMKLIRERTLLREHLYEYNSLANKAVSQRRRRRRNVNLDEIEQHLDEIQREFISLTNISSKTDSNY